jgi:hypothetical protein
MPSCTSSRTDCPLGRSKAVIALTITSFAEKGNLLLTLSYLMISLHGIILILIIQAKTAPIAPSILSSILPTWKQLFASILIIAKSVRKLRLPANDMVIYLNLISFVIPEKLFKLIFLDHGRSRILLNTLITPRVYP